MFQYLYEIFYIKRVPRANKNTTEITRPFRDLHAVDISVNIVFEFNFIENQSRWITVR